MAEKRNVSLNKDSEKQPKVLSLADKLTVEEMGFLPQNAAWFAKKRAIEIAPVTINNGDCRFFRLDSVRELENIRLRSRMENVISAMKDVGYNYLYVLTGSPSGVRINFGVTKNYHGKKSAISNPWNYGDILSGAFRGNLKGSILKDETENVIDEMDDYSRFSIVTGIPQLPNENRQNEVIQSGLDALINGCSDINWRLVVIASPAAAEEINAGYEALCEMYGNFNRSSKNNIQLGDTVQHSTAHTETSTQSHSKTDGKSGGKNTGETINANSGHSTTEGGHTDWSNGTTDSDSSGKSDTKSGGDSQSHSVSYELISKTKMELMKYMDDVLFERMRCGMSKGMFHTDILLMSDNTSDLNRVQSLFCSVFGGNAQELNPLHLFSEDAVDDETLKDIASKMQSDRIVISGVNDTQLIFGHKLSEGKCGSSTLLTAAELSMIAGVPEQEVVGITYRKNADFGLNSADLGDGIKLGNLISGGVELGGKPVVLPRYILNRHVLVAGVTGSGKTTTCQKLLLDSNYNFLVIEPAKTEYRALMTTSIGDKLTIYTLGSEDSPFRLNPFELLRGENFTSHVDMLTASFTSAFPMEAALPQVLEESIYRCYAKYGWVASTGKNKYTDDPFTGDGMYFPTLKDLESVIKDVVNAKGFGMDMERNYIGSLRGRIAALMTGSKGCMLNCRKSIDFEELLKGYVVLELENLRSGNDKSFVMGLIMARLSECLKIMHNKDKDFRHITLIEEAHRLLAKVSSSDYGAKKSAVDSFTDLLAEVRKYGEALIIADQIPNKLAPDVLKNTNTKIIHTIFAADDKEAVGDAMMMDKHQKEYLSSLAPGEVVLFTESTPKPINLKVISRTNTADLVPDDEVKALFAEIKAQNDRIIADGCLFGKLTYEQRSRIDIFDDDFMKTFGDKLQGIIKNIPNAPSSAGELPKAGDTRESDSSADKMCAALVGFCRDMYEIMEKAKEASGLDKELLWRELVWRYMIRTGKIAAHFSRLKEVTELYFTIYPELIDKISEEGKFPGTGVYPDGYIKALKEL